MRTLAFIISAGLLSTSCASRGVRGPETGAPQVEAAPVPAKRSPEEAAVRSREKIEAALGLRKARRYREAIHILREALALEPPDETAAEVLYRLAECHFRQAQDATAGKMSVDPDFASPGQLLKLSRAQDATTGKISVDPGVELLEAARILEDAVKRYPKTAKAPDSAYLRGSTFLLLGRHEDAREAYRKVLVDYPAYEYASQALLRLGVCEASLGERDRAREVFTKLLQGFPDKEADVTKASRYLTELQVFGKNAPPVSSREWLFGMAREGLKTFEGEVIALVFFATWCENCTAEIPHLRSLIQELGGKGVVFLGIANPDDPKSTLPVDVYLQKNEIPFIDVALDRTGGTWGPYRVGSLPAAAVIDRKGVIRWRGHPAFFPKRLVEGLLQEG